MTAYVVLTPEELRLERAADGLLSGDLAEHPPVYTERQLSRHGSRLRVPVQQIARLPAIRGQDIRDELRFLASVTGLTFVQRACLRLWVDGWVQAEIAVKIGLTQQRVSILLEQALVKCYEATPLSFRNFSHHSIYRPPRRRRTSRLERVCPECGDLFDAWVRRGNYCSRRCARTGERA